MKLILNPHFYLTDELGTVPRIVERRTEKAYGPDDSVKLYLGWDELPAREALRRLSLDRKWTQASAHVREMIARFITDGKPLPAEGAERG